MKAISVAATNRSAIFRIILIAPSLRVEETDDRSRATVRVALPFARTPFMNKVRTMNTEEARFRITA